MARTKQTARKSTGGRAPRKAVEQDPFDYDQGNEDDVEEVVSDDDTEGEDTEPEDGAADGNEDVDKDGNKKVYAEPGTLIKLRNLYPGPKDKDGRWSWTTKYPKNLDPPVENRNSLQYALLVRKRKCYDGRKKLEIDSIVVQSDLIKDVLGRVFANYPGITTGLARFELRPPFTPLMFRWARFEEAIAEEEDATCKAHLELLRGVVEPELREIIDTRDDLIKNGVMTYQYLYTLFEPGSLVYAFQDGHHRMYKLMDSHYSSNGCTNFYSLRVEYVDFDGDNFGYMQTNLAINEFRGTAPIVKLSALPLSFVPDLEKKREAVLSRGRLFERYAGYHFQAYDGIAIDMKSFMGCVKYTVNSRVIIDAAAYNRFNPSYKVNLNRIIQNKRVPVAEHGDNACDDDSEDYDAAAHNADVAPDAERLSDE